MSSLSSTTVTFSNFKIRPRRKSQQVEVAFWSPSFFLIPVHLLPCLHGFFARSLPCQRQLLKSKMPRKSTTLNNWRTQRARVLLRYGGDCSRGENWGAPELSSLKVERCVSPGYRQGTKKITSNLAQLDLQGCWGGRIGWSRNCSPLWLWWLHYWTPSFYIISLPQLISKPRTIVLSPNSLGPLSCFIRTIVVSSARLPAPLPDRGSKSEIYLATLPR